MWMILGTIQYLSNDPKETYYPAVYLLLPIALRK